MLTLIYAEVSNELGTEKKKYKSIISLATPIIFNFLISSL